MRLSAQKYTPKQRVTPTASGIPANEEEPEIPRARETTITPRMSNRVPTRVRVGGRSPVERASAAVTTANPEAIGETSDSVPIAKAR